MLIICLPCSCIGHLNTRLLLETIDFDMNRFTLIRILGPFFALVFVQLLVASNRPNILFILIDDLRWDALGIEGHPFVKTPHIDRIAREGIRFTRTFISNPICSPSRASFLTGQYCNNHGIIDNTERGPQSHRLTTFAAPIREAGYATAYLGKWHMGRDNTPRPDWEHWIGAAGNVKHDDPTLNFNGEDRLVKGYLTDLLTDYAIDYINRSDDRPFLLYLSHKSVHSPYIPADRHDDLYADQEIGQNPSYLDTLEGKPLLTPNVTPELTANMTADDFSPQARNQLRMITSVDEGIGRILDALDRIGKLDSTVVVFVSDNGYQWGEHSRRGKRLPYEASARVPLYIRYPSLINPGLVRSQLVVNTDLAPTFTELAGASTLAGVQGRSLVPLFGSSSVAWRSSVFLEYLAEKGKPDAPAWQAVRTSRWKFVRYMERPDVEELYDLRADPFELTNLADNRDLDKTIRSLSKELDRLAEMAGSKIL